MTAMIDSLAGQSFTFPKYPPSGVRDQWTSMVQDQVSELVRTNPEEYFISTNSGFQEGVFKKDSQGANTAGDMDFKHDPLFTGMKDTSKDATNWRDFLKKASKNTNEKWEQLKNDRVDSPQNSKRYSIEEDKHGEKFVLLLLLIAASLMYNEFKYN